MRLKNVKYLIGFSIDSGPMGLIVFVLVGVLCNHNCSLFLPLYGIYALRERYPSSEGGIYILQYIYFSIFISHQRELLSSS